MMKLSNIKGLLSNKNEIMKEFEEKFTYKDKQGNPRMNNTAPRKVRGFITSKIDLMDKTINRDRLVEIILPYIRGIYGYTFARANSNSEMMCEDYDIDFLDKQTEELADQIISKMGEWIC